MNNQVPANAESHENRNHVVLQFDETEMHDIAITRLQFDETEMYEVYILIACAQHSHNRMALRRHLRARGSAMTQQIFRSREGKPAGRVLRGSLAVSG